MALVDREARGSCPTPHPQLFCQAKKKKKKCSKLKNK